MRFSDHIPTPLVFVSQNLIEAEETSDESMATSAAVELYLEKIDDWSFPIFKYSMETNFPLTFLAIKLFEQANLFEMFKLPRTKFRRFLCNLENGYHHVQFFEQNVDTYWLFTGIY